MSGGKPKAKDQSSNKFLQRIAGKKALAPPPTPRPVIGEHPVRTLLRENADAVEPKIPAPAAPVIRDESSASRVVTPPPVETAVPAPQADVSAVAPDAGAAGKVRATKAVQPAAAAPRVKPEGEGSAASPANAEEAILGIKAKYRLNVGEFALYRELYLMSHAAGRAECSFVVSELVEATGMLERRVRDNLRRLKKNGWLVLVEAYDFENREKAKYRLNVEPWT
ncbi:MAG: hypothetical protein ABW250_10415 [Pyrinomonadaceae bacterium]